MARIIIAGLLGAIILFVWGMVSWTILHLHDDSIHTLPDENRVISMLRETVTEPGAYWFPNMPDEDHSQLTDEEKDSLEAAWLERYREGPIGILFFQPEGKEAMSPVTLACGFGMNVIVALIASLMLAAAAATLRGYLLRVLFVMGFGAIVAVYCHGSFWNWMSFPTDYTLSMILDCLVAWTLVGLVIAAVIRPKSDSA